MTQRAVQFGVAVPNWGPFGDPREAARLAQLAEQAGWDGYFTWDALVVRKDPPPTFSPWLILAAVAMATERIRIGTCVAVPVRYKPHLLAMTLANLDVLSAGRVTLGVGLGDGAKTFEAFAEEGDPTIRSEKLDEMLDLITRLWSGDEVTHRGRHYAIDGFTLSPRPVQQPRIPIWVGGDSRAAIRRAARWDGWIGPDDHPLAKTVEDLMEVRARLLAAGAPPDGFDIAWSGMSAGTGDERQAIAQAGATWWIEVGVGSAESVLTRVGAGPGGH